MKYHFLTALTVAIWGTTLVSTKVLLHAGMSPAEILFCRLVLAYIFLWIIYPRRVKNVPVHDELVFALSGLLGVTMYFQLENTALIYTTATNVSLICATVPVFSALASQLILHEKHINMFFIIGSAIAVVGVSLVVLNGALILDVNPLGDGLTVLAVMSWAVYCVALKKLRGNYDSLFITRSTFFYGMITLLPFFVFEPFDFPFSGFLNVEVFANLLFLGLVASSSCFYMWTIAIKNIGVVSANSYIYFMPLVTIITAAIVLEEHVTLYVVIGTVMIIGGLLLLRRKVLKQNKISKSIEPEV